MKKKVSILIISIISFVIGTFIIIFKTGYKVDFNNYDEYLWLFNSEVKNELDTFLFVKDYRKSDAYIKYNLGKATIGIHEIYDLESFDLSAIHSHYNVDLNDIELYPAQVLNKNVNVIPTITAKWKPSFDNTLNITFCKQTKIDTIFSADNYICFHARIHKLLISNNKNEELFYYDFSNKSKNTLLVFFWEGKNLYIIMVNSSEDFGLEMINIFDFAYDSIIFDTENDTHQKQHS